MQKTQQADHTTWEIVVDDDSNSVRRLAVPAGWIYQTQDGRRYHSVAGTIGRERDPGFPTWGPLIFVSSGDVSRSLSSDKASMLRKAVRMWYSTTDTHGFDMSLTDTGRDLLEVIDRLAGEET